MTPATSKRERQIMRTPKGARKDLPWEGNSFSAKVRRGILVFRFRNHFIYKSGVRRMVGIIARHLKVNSGIATELKTEGLPGLWQITDYLARKSERSTWLFVNSSR